MLGLDALPAGTHESGADAVQQAPVHACRCMVTIVLAVVPGLHVLPEAPRRAWHMILSKSWRAYAAARALRKGGALCMS